MQIRDSLTYGTAWIIFIYNFSLPPYTAAGVRTHVSQSSCTDLGPLKDDLPTEIQHRGGSQKSWKVKTIRVGQNCCSNWRWDREAENNFKNHSSRFFHQELPPSFFTPPRFLSTPGNFFSSSSLCLTWCWSFCARHLLKTLKENFAKVLSVKLLFERNFT